MDELSPHLTQAQYSSSLLTKVSGNAANRGHCRQLQFFWWQLWKICLIDAKIEVEQKTFQTFTHFMFYKIATGCHGFLQKNFVIFQPFQPGNTVSFLDQEQLKSPKYALKTAYKCHFLATLDGFFENCTFFKKPFVRNEIHNELYHF